LQVKAASKERKQRTLAALQGVKGKVGVDLISMTLKGKKVSVEKVMKMVDDTVVLLGEEQRLMKPRRSSARRTSTRSWTNRLLRPDTRREENEEHVVNFAANNAAVEFLGFVNLAANNAAVEFLGFVNLAANDAAVEFVNKFHNPLENGPTCLAEAGTGLKTFVATCSVSR